MKEGKRLYLQCFFDDSLDIIKDFADGHGACTHN